MKLVEEYNDSSEAEKNSLRIRRAGVMTVVTSKRSHSLSQTKTGAFKVGLWAVFDEQYEDAIHLLKNPKHKPVKKISLEKMSEIEKNVKNRFSLSVTSLFEKIAVFVFGGILLLLFIYVLIGIIKES